MIRFRDLRQIADRVVQEVIRDLYTDLQSTPVLKSEFKFLEIVITKAETNYSIKHNAGFLPKDVIVTSKTGAGNYTLQYEKFTAEQIFLTTTGPVRLRMLLGRYE